MSSSIQLTGKYAVIAQKMLADVSRILREQQIDCWLDSGTLLGIVRENRLLPWDNDVDISVRSEQVPQVMASIGRLKSAGYDVEVKIAREAKPPLQNGVPRIIKIYNKRWFFFRGPVVLDIFVQTRLEDRYYWSCRPNKISVNYSAPAAFFDQLCEREFAGNVYLVPADTEAYLSYRYGDWRTPRKEWNIATDDNAIT